jgi:protein gp37
VVSGCEHDCAWKMPDGSRAECYAKTVAEGVAQAAYPHGFNYHYYHPERLDEPLKLKESAGLFVDSMADLMGKRVPSEQIEQVLDVMRQASWHTFFLLTKNAPRLRQFSFPPNVWVGVSAPPSEMFGKPLSRPQQVAYLYRAFEVLADIRVPVRWMSIEPLSFDISPHLAGAPLQWAVIGAASRGRTVYQPEPAWVEHTLAALDAMHTAVFFKGNLRGNTAAEPWREDFPDVP